MSGGDVRKSTESEGILLYHLLDLLLFSLE